MEHWTGIVGLLLAGLMVFQMSAIASRREGKWRETALFYKANILCAVVIASAGWLVLFVLAVSQPFVPEKSWFFKGYDYLFGASSSSNPSKWETSAVVILIAFFTGAVRLLFEQSSDDPRTIPVFFRDFFRSFFKPGKLYGAVYRLNPKELGESAKHDSWIWWFAITVVLAIFPDSIPLGSHERLRSVIVSSVAFFGYFTWIYIGLHNKLTRGHNFSALASRAFLGDLLHQYVPLQAVVIGPRGVGKTCFIRAAVVRGQHPTDVPNVHLFQASEAKISVVDTPGENLGDHLLIVAKYRTDTLVLLLDACHLETENLSDRAHFTDRECPRLFKEGTASRGYLERFVSATKSDEFALPKQEVFKVLSFMLFLNFRETDRDRLQPVLELLESDDRLQMLSKSLGLRFGVDAKNCCAIVQPAPQEGVARKLIAIDPEDRLANVHGHSPEPRNQVPAHMAAEISGKP